MAVGWEISIWEKTHLVHPNVQLSAEILNACFPPSQVEKIAEPLSRNTAFWVLSLWSDTLQFSDWPSTHMLWTFIRTTVLVIRKESRKSD